MDIVKLKNTDIEMIRTCDILFKKFLNSEGKYDGNYIERENIKSFEKDLIDNTKTLYVAKENEIVEGFLYAYISKSKNEKEEVAHLCFLYVDEKYRNKKVATNLIQKFINEMKLIGITNIDVKVFEENEIAKKLYKKFEFENLWVNLRLKI